MLRSAISPYDVGGDLRVEFGRKGMQRHYAMKSCGAPTESVSNKRSVITSHTRVALIKELDAASWVAQQLGKEKIDRWDG